MKHFILIVFLYLIANNSFGFVLFEPGVGVSFGTTEVDQVVGAENYKHEGWLASLMANGKLGFNVFNLVAGIDYTYDASSLKTKRSATAGSITSWGSYNISLEQKLLGYFAGFQFGPSGIRLWGTYYDNAKGEVTYAEGDGANIFKKGDTLKGSGFGLGISASPYKNIRLFLEGRRISYNQLILNGTTENIPNSNFVTKYQVTQVTLGGSLAFDFF
jgi:hypothetical protein